MKPKIKYIKNKKNPSRASLPPKQQKQKQNQTTVNNNKKLHNPR